MKKIAYNVRLRRQKTGEEQVRLVLASDPGRAGTHAAKRAKLELKLMADRQYAEFEVLSCVPALGQGK